MAARILLRAQADALSSTSRCSRPPTPPQLNNLIAAKYSHRSKDSGGPGTTLCCVARFLTAEHLSHGKTYCSEQFSFAAAKPIHPANPAKGRDVSLLFGFEELTRPALSGLNIVSSFLRLAQVSRSQLGYPQPSV